MLDLITDLLQALKLDLIRDLILDLISHLPRDLMCSWIFYFATDSTPEFIADLNYIHLTVFSISVNT
jgi:hypothetical protein